MNRAERITHYEAILDRADAAARQLEQALAEYDSVLPDVEALEAYYTSAAWREDLEADEAGLLPEDLKRGVLSQDAVWNLLERCASLRRRVNPE